MHKNSLSTKNTAHPGFSLAGRPLIIGTLILTATGLITRTIGFFYRIYLSRLFGEESMGVYQLISPVLALSYSLCAAAYQTAISKLVAEYTDACNNRRFRPLIAGLMITIPLSLLCCGIIHTQADFIGTQLLMEPRTVPMLQILAFAIPFSSIHSCINGYFYGIKKTGPPAAAQFLEQLARVSCVYLISSSVLAKGGSPSITVAVLGLVTGELVSMTVSLTAIFYTAATTQKAQKTTGPDHCLSLPSSTQARICSKATGPVSALHAGLFRSIFAMALPLTLNRIVLNFLQSIESVSIPTQLKLYGYDNTTALSVYGVLTGMAMPLIFFPNALTNSVSVLLLPLIAENYSRGDLIAVKAAILRTLKFCTTLGLTCMSAFFLLGNFFGNTVFDSPLAGHFIQTLSFLCPFLYLDTTLSSILQGLGKAGTIFIMNMLALLLRLGFVFFAVPTFGITGYLWGMLAGQIFLSVMYLGCLRKFLVKA